MVENKKKNDSQTKEMITISREKLSELVKEELEKLLNNENPNKENVITTKLRNKVGVVREDLKKWFYAGEIPKQEHFEVLIDSFVTFQDDGIIKPINTNKALNLRPRDTSLWPEEKWPEEWKEKWLQKFIKKTPNLSSWPPSDSVQSWLTKDLEIQANNVPTEWVTKTWPNTHAEVTEIWFKQNLPISSFPVMPLKNWPQWLHDALKVTEKEAELKKFPQEWLRELLSFTNPDGTNWSFKIAQDGSFFICGPDPETQYMQLYIEQDGKLKIIVRGTLTPDIS